MLYGTLENLGFQPLFYCLKNIKISDNVRKYTLYQVKKFETKALNSIEAFTKNFVETNLTQPQLPKLGFGFNKLFPILIKHQI